MLRGPAKQHRIIRMEATTMKTQEILLPSNVIRRRTELKSDHFKLGPGTPKSFKRLTFLNTNNLIYNSKVKLHRYVIDRGETVVTFDLSFKIFELVLDFKYLNCRGVKIYNYTQILL